MNTSLKVSVVLTAVGLAGLVTAPQAAAYTDADVRYLACLTMGWGHPSTDPAASVRFGHRIADAIQAGDTPVGDRNWIYAHTDIADMYSANVMVNCATSAYLGFGPPLA